MIKNHTHSNDSGSIHFKFKKILDLGIIKEAFAIIPLFFKQKLCISLQDLQCTCR